MTRSRKRQMTDDEIDSMKSAADTVNAYSAGIMIGFFLVVLLFVAKCAGAPI